MEAFSTQAARDAARIQPPPKLDRVLIIDDSDTIVRQLDQILRNVLPEAAVYAARDVATARELFEQTRPTLVFLDMMLAGEAGKTFMPVYAKATHACAVVVLTALDRTHPDVEDAISHGAIAYLQKPLRRAQVEVALGEIRHELRV